ncbi:MAG: hypothetical protein OEZ65_13270 [Gemmatimonadota bacterium]|nr:hypothetical protein [Gemmatimonadota bacterium]MDH5760553.1 hypothetical protein [Gemmatimonadota bacterium]
MHGIRESGARLPEAAKRLAESLADDADGCVRGILLYGSHILGARPGRHSAYDLVVVVDEYGPFHRAMKRAGAVTRPPWLLTSMAHLLAPNTTAYQLAGAEDVGLAKCLIVSDADFTRALGSRPRDHFLLGRLVQRVALLWWRDEASARSMEHRIQRARAGVVEWMAPYLPAEFDAESLGARMLDVCYRGEIRPEAGDRSQQVFEAQRSYFAEVFPDVLEEGVRRGALARGDDGRYSLTAEPGHRVRMRWRWHFVRSKVRATLRWFKHIVTFDNWLPYIERKVERRTGIRYELTARERRWPLIFLWPRVIHMIRNRPSDEDDASGSNFRGGSR